jgi:hypothetical protein
VTRIGWTRRARPYEEAQKIFRELARKNPDVYVPDVAMTLNNLETLDRNQNPMQPRVANLLACICYRDASTG